MSLCKNGGVECSLQSGFSSEESCINSSRVIVSDLRALITNEVGCLCIFEWLSSEMETRHFDCVTGRTTIQLSHVLENFSRALFYENFPRYHNERVHDETHQN